MADVEVKLDIGKVAKILRPLAELGMDSAALYVERTVKTSFKPGTGRTYIRGGKVHRASAPGEPPAVDTGRLRNSITHDVVAKGDEIIGRVGTNVEYAKELEFGSPKIKPRPYFRPAVFNNKRDIIKEFEKGAKRAGGIK